MTPDERAARVVDDLDAIARDWDQYEYGLPIYGDTRERLDTVVANAIRDAEAAVIERCARKADAYAGECRQTAMAVKEVEFQESAMWAAQGAEDVAGDIRELLK